MSFGTAKIMLGNSVVRPVYVGGKTFTTTSDTAPAISLTDLTGGLSSAPSAGDFVLVAISHNDNADRADTVPGYANLGVDLYANSSSDTNLLVFYKQMGATPDGSVTLSISPNFSAWCVSVAIHVYRGVNPVTPNDVSPATATSTASANADAPAISPITPGAMVVVIAASATSGTATPSAMTQGGELQNFLSDKTVNGNFAGYVAMGSYPWVSGSFNPAAFTNPDTVAGSTWCAATLALRPA